VSARAKAWPLALAGVLGVTVVANGLMLWAASGPGSAVIERDYYRRAVGWDSTMAIARSSAALGWRVEADLLGSAAGGAVLRVALADRDGHPLPDARVLVTAIHNLEAARPTVIEAQSGPDGVATTRLPLDRPGLWELRLDVRRRGDRFQTTVRRDHAPHVSRLAGGTAP
jgi:nitrogen fixation protein FixH